MDNYNDNQEQAPIEPVTNEVPETSITPETQTQPFNEPAPVNVQPAKKSKTGLIITFIVLIVVLVGAIVAILIFSNNNGNNGNNGGNSVVEDVETEIAEGTESKAMNDNLRIILSQQIDTTSGPLVSRSILLNYAKEVIDGTFESKNQKLDAVLRYLWVNDKFTAINKADYTDSEDLTAYYGLYGNVEGARESFFADTTTVSAETVTDLYYKVFGEEPEHQNADHICGGFLYNPNHKVYYNGPLNACGGIPATGYFFKNVGYSKKGDTYYADYRISYHEVEGKSSKNNGVDDTGVSKYYAGRDKSFELIKSFEKPLEYSVDAESKLTDSEWEKVKTYRFVFVKNGDDFNYTGIEEK